MRKLIIALLAIVLFSHQIFAQLKTLKYFGGTPVLDTLNGIAFHKYLDGTRISESDFKRSEEIVLKADEKLQDGNLDEAMNYAVRALDVNPHNYQAYWIIGVVKQYKEELDEAVINYKSSLEICPKFTLSLIELAKIERVRGNQKEAIVYCDKVLQLDSLNENGFYHRGSAYLLLKEYEKAMQDFESAISINPRAEYYHDKGASLVNLGKKIEGYQYYDTALIINPRLEIALFNKGYLDLFEFSKPEKAFESFKKLTEINPNYANAFTYLGITFEELKGKNKATDCYRKAIEVNPSDKLALELYKRLAGEDYEPVRNPTLWIISVGIDTYQNDYMFGTIDFSVNSAHLIAKLFENYWNLEEKNVILLTNKNAIKRSILDSLKQFTNPIKLSKEDMVIFFFSGHGKMAGNKIGICAWDYSSEKNLIVDSDIVDILNRCPAKHKICLIEACRSSSEMDGNVDPKLVEQLNKERKKIGGGLVYITSTDAGLKSYGKDELGIFTKYLLDGLKNDFADINKDRTISVEELFNYVQDQVSRETKGQQIPQINKEGYDKSMPIVKLPK